MIALLQDLRSILSPGRMTILKRIILAIALVLNGSQSGMQSRVPFRIHVAASEPKDMLSTNSWDNASP